MTLGVLQHFAFKVKRTQNIGTEQKKHDRELHFPTFLNPCYILTAHAILGATVNHLPLRARFPSDTSGVRHQPVNRAVWRTSKSLAVALIVSATLKHVLASPNSCKCPPPRQRDPLFRTQAGVFTWPMLRRANKLI